jgi:lipoprotein-releasing system ATP-binding protein
MSANDVILEAEGIHKSYRMGAAQVKVLKGASLRVRRGEFVAIVGASGSGKSTLLHILGALDRADKGVVRFEGQDLSKASAARLNRFRNREVGFVFQFYHLLDELNILENVYLPKMASKSVLGWLACSKAAKKRARALLEEFGLGERFRHRPFELSGGRGSG